MRNISIIIVNYNTADLTVQCLNSIKKQSYPLDKVECLVVDNGSTDKSVALIKKSFNWVNLFEVGRNIGFAAANNLAIKRSVGKNILLLNSDTIIMKETLKKMISLLDRDGSIGAATPRIDLMDGGIDPACHRGFPTPWNAFCYFLGLEKIFPKIKIFSGYHQTYKDLTKQHQVDSISGACFFTRKEVIKKVGLLDERFFMYAEDIDWCLRIKEKCYKIIFFPDASIIHFKHLSGRKKVKAKNIQGGDNLFKIKKQTDQHFFQTMKIFYEKHYKNKYPGWVRSLVIFGIWLKMRVNNQYL